MKSLVVCLSLILFTSANTFAQSKSFEKLKGTFKESEDVFSFSTSGFLARTILRMAGDDEINKSIRNIKNIRLITIPKAAFAEKDKSVSEFRKMLKSDSYEELAYVSDQGGNVSLYLQSNKKHKNDRYLFLIEEATEVVVIELKGYVDPATITSTENNLALSL